MSVNDIEFYQLTSDFYVEHNHLIELVDKEKGGNLTDKGRGYGVLLIKVQGYKFAIPLRSKMHINHKDNFTTRIYEYRGKKVRHGLDYSKAVIITDMRFVDTSSNFQLHKKSDFLSIRKAEHIIIPAFEKYISRYVKAIKKPDKNILKRYKFSTLQNYHHELGLIVPSNK